MPQEPDSTARPGTGGASRRALAGWFLYDWANSAFPTLIVTFVFAVYFTQGIAETPEE